MLASKQWFVTFPSPRTLSEFNFLCPFILPKTRSTA